MKNTIKNIVVIALGFLGDTLLVEPMCKNIKKSFPNANLIFIANDVFKEIPLGFESVDKIYGYDKKDKHKGLLGYFKFKKEFTEKEIDYAIITHPHERSILLAKAIGAKNIVSLPIKKSPLNILINKKRTTTLEEIRNTYKADFNNKYLDVICESKNFPVSFVCQNSPEKNLFEKFNLPQNYIVLSPTSKDIIKDWDYKNIKEFIINCTSPVVIVGTARAHEIAQKLKSENINFSDLTLKTNLLELACIIKNSQYCVSVDTGTLHLAYAQQVKTIGIFFNEQMTKEWTPENLSNLKILFGKREGNKQNFVCTKEVSAAEVLAEIKKCNTL